MAHTRPTSFPTMPVMDRRSHKEQAIRKAIVAGGGACAVHLPKTILESCASYALALQNADILVTGTLGLAAPRTRAAIKAAAAAVKAGGGKVLVDINWRPVFWDDQEAAKKEILEYLELADIVKISDADLEFLYDIPFVTGLLNPCAVGACSRMVKGVAGPRQWARTTAAAISAATAAAAAGMTQPAGLMVARCCC